MNNLNNSLSGFIYYQKGINNYIFNNENSLSGLIYTSQNLIYNNFFNQDIINVSYGNYLNSLQNQINNNNKTSNKASNGNTAGNIVNGLATLGVGLASAFLFSTLFASVASLQAQLLLQQVEGGFSDTKTVSLQVQINILNKQVGSST